MITCGVALEVLSVFKRPASKPVINSAAARVKCKVTDPELLGRVKSLLASYAVDELDAPMPLGVIPDQYPPPSEPLTPPQLAPPPPKLPPPPPQLPAPPPPPPPPAARRGPLSATVERVSTVTLPAAPPAPPWELGLLPPEPP